jgi:hypothetical protein
MKRIAILVAVVATCSACLRSTTVISVKADGSGTVVQETGLNPQALGMLRGMAASGEQGKAMPEVFGEEQARKAAAVMGVQFVSGEPIKTADLEGYRARFAFADVRQLQMKMNQNTTVGLKDDGAAQDPPFGFEFEKRANGGLLTIKVPQQSRKAGALGAMPRMPETADAQSNQQAISMMKLMMQGLFVDISLEVDGRIVKTDAPHVNGSRITLLQLDFNRLLADEAGFQKLQSANDLEALAGVPGLKVLTTPKVTVEFQR